MSILHYILTGKDFAETRNRWHENTWLKRIGSLDDYVVLEGEFDSNRKAFGGGTPEGPGLNSILKIKAFYKHIYKHWHNKYSRFDWFFFSDSDGYVYPDRLKNFLQNFDGHINPLFVGRLHQVDSHPWELIGETHNCKLSTFIRDDMEWGRFIAHSGGAGWALNSKAMRKICIFVTKNNPIISEHYDLAHALWVHECDIPMVHSRKFREEPITTMKEFGDYFDDDVITHHYMKEEDFYFVESQLNK